MPRKPAPRWYKRAFFAVFLAVSLVFVGVAIFSIVADATVVSTTGTVVADSPRHREGRGYSVEFTTADGTFCHSYVDSNTIPASVEIGAIITINYPQIGDPCVLATGERSNLAPLVCGAIVFFIIGAAGTWIAWSYTDPDGKIRF